MHISRTVILLVIFGAGAAALTAKEPIEQQPATVQTAIVPPNLSVDCASADDALRFELYARLGMDGTFDIPPGDITPEHIASLRQRGVTVIFSDVDGKSFRQAILCSGPRTPAKPAQKFEEPRNNEHVRLG